MELAYQLPLRHFQQMVRIVRNDGVLNQYKLANAFGVPEHSDKYALSAVSPTTSRMRTLDEMNITSASLRRPQQESPGGEFSPRTTTIHYHALNATSRAYFNGTSPKIQARTDSMPGTKMRTELGRDSFSTKIEPLIQLSQFAPLTSKIQKTAKSSPGFNAFS